MLYVIEPPVMMDILNKGLITNQNYVIINVDSMAMNWPSLNIIPPINCNGWNLEDPSFDKMVINFLLSNVDIFVRFLEIVIPLRDGKDVFALVYRNHIVFDQINEIIFKLIQQRYGYNYQEILSIDDFDPTVDIGSFTTPGIMQFDSDFNIYEQYYNSKK